MRHMKRHKVPKNWPIPRKGTTFVVKASSKGIPVLVVLRDMLKIVQTRKEAKKAIYQKNILLNTKPVKEDKTGVALFDTLTIVPGKKNYRMNLTENGKYTLEEINEKKASQKISKIRDKKTLKGKKTQLNLYDGGNFLSDIKCNTNDSVVIDLIKKQITKCLELKEKAPVMIFAGKHAGKRGVIEKLKLERKMASIKTKDEKINVLIKQLMVVENE